MTTAHPDQASTGILHSCGKDCCSQPLLPAKVCEVHRRKKTIRDRPLGLKSLAQAHSEESPLAGASCLTGDKGNCQRVCFRTSLNDACFGVGDLGVGVGVIDGLSFYKHRAKVRHGSRHKLFTYSRWHVLMRDGDKACLSCGVGCAITQSTLDSDSASPLVGDRRTVHHGLDRPAFCRRPQAIIHGYSRGVHEQQAIHG